MAAVALAVPLVAQDPVPPVPNRGIAVGDRGVYVLRGDTVFKLNPTSLAIEARVTLPADAEPRSPRVAAAEEAEPGAVARRPEPKPKPKPVPGAEERRAWAKGAAAAVDRGLDWLARYQSPEGRWDADQFMANGPRASRPDGAGSPETDIGLTGLALLAFLQDGQTHRAGPHKDHVARGLAWLREQQGDNGLFGTPASPSFIYGHAIATCAVVEAHRLANDRPLGSLAQRALNYLESHRNPYSVWRYQPRDNDNDTSVSSWCVRALTSGFAAGLEINPNALKLAESWLDQMTDPVTGRVGYNRRGGLSSRTVGDVAARFPPERVEAMTAAAILWRSQLGTAARNEGLVRTQTQLLLTKQPRVGDGDEPGYVDYYYWRIGAEALATVPDEGAYWSWMQALGDELLPKQRTDGGFAGSWDPIGPWGGTGGRVYATAMAVSALSARRAR